MFITAKRLGILGVQTAWFRKNLTLRVESVGLLNIFNHFPFLFDNDNVYPLTRSLPCFVWNANTYKLYYLLPDFCLFRTLKLQTKTYIA
jgi:hypothetical protein